MSQSADQTIEVQVTITNKLGMHARPAMALVDIANSFKSDISIKKEKQKVDAKSIMQVMLLAATAGTDLVIEAIGPDAEKAATAIKDLVDRKFDEE